LLLFFVYTEDENPRNFYFKKFRKTVIHV